MRSRLSAKPTRTPAIEDLQAQQYQAAAPEPAAPAKDPMEQLKELAALHEQGVLTDAEFEIQKTKILQSM